MRKTYISPEYTYTKVNGTYNMEEQSSFFGSKMLKITNSIVCDNQNIIYYQDANNQQLNLSVESSLPPVVYSPSSDKLSNSALVVDPSQSSFQMDNNTAYILTINLNTILTDFIFATLKQYRAFQGVSNAMCVNNNVDSSINTYISDNITNRYQFSQIQLYLQYNDLTLPGLVNPTSLRFQNSWNDEIASSNNLTNILNNITVNTASDYSTTTVNFNQEQPSISYNFDYYFILTWVII